MPFTCAAFSLRAWDVGVKECLKVPIGSIPSVRRKWLFIDDPLMLRYIACLNWSTGGTHPSTSPTTLHRNLTRFSSFIPPKLRWYYRPSSLSRGHAGPNPLPGPITQRHYVEQKKHRWIPSAKARLWPCQALKVLPPTTRHMDPATVPRASMASSMGHEVHKCMHARSGPTPPTWAPSRRPSPRPAMGDGAMITPQRREATARWSTSETLHRSLRERNGRGERERGGPWRWRRGLVKVIVAVGHRWWWE